MKLLIMQLPLVSVTSSLFSPNILLSSLFSNTLSLCSSLNVTHQVVNTNHYSQRKKTLQI
jgi:hypothetical protein